MQRQVSHWPQTEGCGNSGILLGQTKNPPEDNAQKIFKAEFRGRDIGYAVTGAATNNTGTFNIFTELDGFLSSESSCQSLSYLMPRISARLKQPLRRRKKMVDCPVRSAQMQESHGKMIFLNKHGSLRWLL